ncbi:MAG TPA: hypothetical protein VHV79_05495 [Mycobacteriales bacterium]|nr:hypothetical protein [Mycobacteriales bacterium]
MNSSLVGRGVRLSRLVAGVVLALVMVGVGVPQPGYASSRAHVSSAPVAVSFRLKAVAGSARYLIYTKLGVQADGRLTGRGGLFVLTSNGAARRLTTITTDDGSYSLTGNSLVYVEGQTLIVHWWNIVTGAHRQFVYHDDSSIHQRLGAYGAAPHGVLVGEDDSTHPHDQLLEVDRFDGKLHPLDAPFPNRLAYGLYDTGGQVVVFDLNNGSHDGAVKIVSFTKPGQARTLASSGLGPHLCPSATHYYVACQVTPNPSSKNLAPYSMHLLSTDGRRHASTTKGCASPYAGVLGHSAAWIVIAHQSCPAYHLWTLNINGKVHESTRTFTVAAPIAAFHQVVVDNRAKTSLDELSSANAKPRVLVHVK